MQLLIDRGKSCPIHRQFAVVPLLEEEEVLSTITIRICETGSAAPTGPYKFIRWSVIIEVVLLYNVSMQLKVGDAQPPNDLDHPESDFRPWLCICSECVIRWCKCIALYLCSNNRICLF